MKFKSESKTINLVIIPLEGKENTSAKILSVKS